jgi:hypothetical protein
MSHHDQTYGPGGDRRARAVELIAGGHTTAETAAIVGVVPDTVARWRRDPRFRAQVEAIAQEARKEIGIRLGNLASKALHTLEEILDDPQAERWARLRAAENILSRGGFSEQQGRPGGQDGGQGGFAVVAQLFQQRLAGLPEGAAGPELEAE